MDTVGVFNLIASIFSIVTGGVALALSIVFYLGGKKAERNSELAMIKIQEVTLSLSSLSMRMLNKVTTAMITPKPTDEKLTDILKAVKEGGQLSPSTDGDIKMDKTTIEQFRVDNLVAAYYYCTLTNLAYQTMLPQSIGETTGYEIVTSVVDQTRNDSRILKSWIDTTKDIASKISASPVQHLYQTTLTLEDSILSVVEHYATKENQTT